MLPDIPDTRRYQISVGLNPPHAYYFSQIYCFPHYFNLARGNILGDSYERTVASFLSTVHLRCESGNPAILELPPLAIDNLHYSIVFPDLRQPQVYGRGRSIKQPAATAQYNRYNCQMIYIYNILRD